MRCESLDDTRFMELFELATETPRSARPRRLVDACDGDEQLAREIAARADSHEAMGDFLLIPPVPSLADDVRFAVGDLVAGRFAIIREVGEGGMGVVYEAHDRKVDRRCALKCPKPGFARQLPAETSVALSITHDNVCRVYGIYTTDTRHGPVDVLVMEFIDGETLTERLARTGPLPEDLARDVVLQVCGGVQTAHASGILHGDLKSNNIMLAGAPGGRVRAVITDFGLAGQLEADGATRSGLVAGTPAFMAPELFKGEPASIASDVYALGVVIYEMVTGRLPQQGDDVPPTRVRAGLHRRWDRATARCLAVSIERRARSADDVARILRGRPQSVVWGARAAAAALTVMAIFAARPDPPRLRLAVLPANVNTGDEELSAIAAGLIDDVSRRLTMLEGRNDTLIVIPLPTVLSVGARTPQRALATLGATHVLVSSVSRSERGFTVAADVTNARTLVGTRNWHAEYPRGNLRDAPVAISGAVSAALGLVPVPPSVPMAPDVYAAYTQGLSQLRAGPHLVDAAIANLEKASHGDAKSWLPPAALAEAFLSKFHVTRDRHWITRAEESLALAESRQPDDAEVRIAAGRLQRISGRYERSIAEFERAITLDPGNVDAWVGLARTYESTGTRAAEAAASYQKAADLRPDYYLPHLEFGTFYYQRGEYQQAEPHMRRAMEIAPDNPAALATLTALYGSWGRFADAERLVRRSLALSRTRAALVNLGAILNFQRRDRDALELYQEALEESESTELMVNLGDTYRRLGLAAEATAAYTRGLARADADVLRRDDSARAFAAYFMARLGQVAPARREIEQAVAFAPSDMNIIRRAAMTYEALGDRAATLAVIKDAQLKVLEELSRHPDLTQLATDPRFMELMRVARARDMPWQTAQDQKK